MLSATIAAFSASLQRRRRGVPVKTSTRRKLCPSIGKLLGTRSPCSIKTTAAGSRHCHRPPQGGDQAPLTVLRDADRAFWTRTVWRDEAAMRAFMRSGVHRRIMARLSAWCDEAALVPWVQDDSEPPSWQEAHRRLQKEGRRSRVSHPSEAQRRFEIREPRTSGGGRSNDRWGLLSD